MSCLYDECEFDERDFRGNIIGEQKAIISFEFSENSNGLTDYDPIFSTIN